MGQAFSVIVGARLPHRASRRGRRPRPRTCGSGRCGGRPARRPASIGPPETKMVGMLSRAAAISRPGHVFVAVGDHDQTVKLVGHEPWPRWSRQIRSRVTREYFIPTCPMAMPSHTAMAGNIDGRAARGADTGLDGLGDLVEVHVAGDDLVVGADHADQRARQLLVRIAQGVQRGCGSARAPRRI